MAHAKCSLCKHEDQSLDPWQHSGSSHFGAQHQCGKHRRQTHLWAVLTNQPDQSTRSRLSERPFDTRENKTPRGGSNRGRHLPTTCAEAFPIKGNQRFHSFPLTLTSPCKHWLGGPLTQRRERSSIYQACGKVSHTDKKHPMVVGGGVEGICLLAENLVLGINKLVAAILSPKVNRRCWYLQP